ncbi:choloylglycine hydrolase family protein [Enterococcus termitis]
MCTSLTFTSTQGNHFLARTMDFGFELDGRPIVMPRNHEWTTHFGQKQKSSYGFVGTGRKLEEYFFADGVNEHGLSVAELYFPNEAKYLSEPIENKLNLAPHEFILWLLGEMSSIEELKQRVNEVVIVNAPVSLLGITVPLHFIVADKSGNSIVVETNSGKIEIKDNPIGVMTNSPELEWHLKNLNNYIFIRPTNASAISIDDFTLKPFGQGSGTFGLPGGYTSPERFVRTVYTRHLTEKGQTTKDAVNAVFHILNNVTIPKGVNIKDDGAVDYTQYRVVMDTDELVYYLNPYSTQEVFSVKLTENLLTTNEPTEFGINPTFNATSLN